MKKMKNKNNLCPPSPYSQNSSVVSHPPHYGGQNNPYETIKVIEAWDLNFHLGNVLKYISRAGKKENQDNLTDLKKAQWYLNRYLEDFQIIKIKKLDI